MEADRLGGRGVVTLILDTNILMYMARGLVAPSEFLDALGASYRLVIPDRVIEELETIAESGRPSSARIARKALEIVSRLAVVEETQSSRADDSVVELAYRLKNTTRVVVATADRELRARLRKAGVSTLYYRRSRGGVEIEWEPPL